MVHDATKLYKKADAPTVAQYNGAGAHLAKELHDTGFDPDKTSAMEWGVRGAGALAGGLLSYWLSGKIHRKPAKWLRALYAIAGAFAGGYGLDKLLDAGSRMSMRVNGHIGSIEDKDKREKLDKEWTTLRELEGAPASMPADAVPFPLRHIGAETGILTGGIWGGHSYLASRAEGKKLEHEMNRQYERSAEFMRAANATEARLANETNPSLRSSLASERTTKINESIAARKLGDDIKSSIDLRNTTLQKWKRGGGHVAKLAGPAIVGHFVVDPILNKYVWPLRYDDEQKLDLSSAFNLYRK